MRLRVQLCSLHVGGGVNGPSSEQRIGVPKTWSDAQLKQIAWRRCPAFRGEHHEHAIRLRFATPCRPGRRRLRHRPITIGDQRVFADTNASFLVVVVS